jgi:hypothetical protein
MAGQLEIEAGDVVKVVLQFFKENNLTQSYAALQSECQVGTYNLCIYRTHIRSESGSELWRVTPTPPSPVPDVHIASTTLFFVYRACGGLNDARISPRTPPQHRITSSGTH